MTHHQRGLATANPNPKRRTRQGEALRLLHRSIDDQIEAQILQHPDCLRAESLLVDQLLLTSEVMG